MLVLHPLIVDITIFMLATALAGDLLYLIAKNDKLWKITSYLLVIGTLSAAAAVITGGQAFDLLEKGRELEQVVGAHRNSGQITLWIFIFLIATRFLFIQNHLFKKPVKWIYYGVAVIAMVFLFRTGFLGNKVASLKAGSTAKEAEAPPSKPSFEEDTIPQYPEHRRTQ